MILAQSARTAWYEGITYCAMGHDIKIVHLIAGLGSGGAEMMLFKLLSTMAPDRFRSVVVSMTNDDGLMAAKIRALGVDVLTLGMKSGAAELSAIARLVRILRRETPDILQAWMYHADLLGLVAGRAAGTRRILWNIRASDHAGRAPALRRVFAAHAPLARFADVVVVNSQAGLNFHEAHGHHARRWKLIHNGFDTVRLRSQPEMRARVRSELGIRPHHVAIGMMARFDPVKDHTTFLSAARRLAEAVPDVVFVLAGAGITVQNEPLIRRVRELGLESRMRLLGEQALVDRIYPAIDIATLCSTTEGMPNALGEAMSCEIPCVTTDVGDSAILLGDGGRIVPRRDPEALARGWSSLIEAGSVERQRLGTLARSRIQAQFSLRAVVSQYERLYEELVECAA